RMGNEWYDRLVSIGKIADRAERRRQLDQYTRDLQHLATEAKNPGRIAFRFFTAQSIAEFASPLMGKMLVALFMPALNAVFNAEDRVALYNQMAEVALALSAYRAEHGQYPDELAQLTPKYLAEIPQDIYSPDGVTIRYRREGEAYILWNVGLNGV